MSSASWRTCRTRSPNASSSSPFIPIKALKVGPSQFNSSPPSRSQEHHQHHQRTSISTSTSPTLRFPFLDPTSLTSSPAHRRLTNNPTPLPRRLLLSLPLPPPLVRLRPLRVPQDMEPHAQNVLHPQLRLHSLPDDARVRTHART